MMTEREAQWLLLGPEETQEAAAAFKRWRNGSDVPRIDLLLLRGPIGEACWRLFLAGYQAAQFEYAVKGGR